MLDNSSYWNKPYTAIIRNKILLSYLELPRLWKADECCAWILWAQVLIPFVVILHDNFRLIQAKWAERDSKNVSQTARFQQNLRASYPSKDVGWRQLPRRKMIGSSVWRNVVDFHLRKGCLRWKTATQNIAKLNSTLFFQLTYKTKSNISILWF